MLELRSRGCSRERQHPAIHRNDGSVLLFDEREAVYTGSRSVNTISGVGDGAGGSCWKCTVAAAFDVERIRRGRYGWNDEGRKFLWG